MLTTENYKFKKPELTDSPPDITVMNFNWDTIDEKLFEVIQAWENFKANGGEIGGVIKGKEGTDGHRLFEHIGVFNNRNAKIRTGSANYNGSPSWSYIVDDIDEDTNSNGIVYLLGTGKSGDIYKDNYLRPWKQGHNNGKNYLGSTNVPWDDVWLVGRKVGTTGYAKLANGIIVQWGEIRGWALSGNGVNNYHSVTLPLEYPTAQVFCDANVEYNTSENSGAWIEYINLNARKNGKAGIHLNAANIHKFWTGTKSFTISWFSVGY